MDDQPAFGDMLKRARQAAGFTQEALAVRAGVSARAISDLERGVKHVPRRDTVRLLVAALPLSPQERASFEAAARRGGAATTLAAALDAPALVPRPNTPLVGQLHARTLLARHAAGDGPPLLALAGEPGIGKTRLLEWAAEQGAARGLRVLHGRCPLGAGRTPYEPLRDALQGYIRHRSPIDLREDLRGCAWLVRALPELADGPIEPLPSVAPPPLEESRLTAEAVARFLSNVAGPAGMLLVLDDLHMAAAAALDLLLALLWTADAVPLRVVAAYRDTETRRGDPLDALLAAGAQAGAVTRLALPRLGPRDAAQLLDELLWDAGAVVPSVRERVARRADGVPFFLVEWARELRLEHGADGAADRVPWAVARSVLRRIDAAPATVRTALEIAAVAGEPLDPTLLLPWLAGTMEAAEALDTAAHARLLRADADGYRFAHEVIRAVVAADLSPARRAALRQRLTMVAAREGRDTGALDTRIAGAGDDRAVMDERRYHLAVLTRYQRASG